MSVADSPHVFDAALVRTRRDRAAGGFMAASHLKARAVDDVCDRLDMTRRDFPRALDLGSHGGFFGRAASQRGWLGSKIGWLAEADVSPAMIARRAGPGLVTEAEVLPLAPESLDLIVSTVWLHWINDLPGILAQVRRALRPDGLFVATFLGGRTLQELRGALVQAEDELRGGVGARVSPFADAQDGAQLLQRAGFALPVADSDLVRVRYASPFGLFRDLKAMGETAAFAERSGRPLTRSIIARAADLYVERHSDPDGRIAATFELVTVTGWAPHESQQKPLRPGSAQVRLADALGVAEHGAGEKAGG